MITGKAITDKVKGVYTVTKMNVTQLTWNTS